MNEFHPAFKLAVKEASKSGYKQQIGAVIFKGKRIVSSAFNETNYNGQIPKKFREFDSSTHAEASAIASARGRSEDCDIIVVRLSKSKEKKYNMAKPCWACEQYINKAGIKKVYYTDENGEIKQFKVEG